MNSQIISYQIVSALVYIMEGMGVFIIAFGAFKAFSKYAVRFFDFNDDNIKLEFARALALGLEFKLGAEILKTLMIRTIDELVILGSIVLLRVALTFVIHWEIRTGTEEYNKSNGLDLDQEEIKNNTNQ